MLFTHKKGLIHLGVLVLVIFSLIAVTSIVTLAGKTEKSRLFEHLLPRKPLNNNPTPTGTIQADPTVVYLNSSEARVVFTAKNVRGANGARVDNVRYFLLRPALQKGHNWGIPDWCSQGSTCPYMSPNDPSYFTYDISQSSNPNNNYEIVWDSKTHSSGSTQYSRALIPKNISPGTYTVGLRVEDVNGNVNGMANSILIEIKKDKQDMNSSCASEKPTVSFNPNPAKSWEIVTATITARADCAGKKVSLESHWDNGAFIFGLTLSSSGAYSQATHNFSSVGSNSYYFRVGIDLDNNGTYENWSKGVTLYVTGATLSPSPDLNRDSDGDGFKDSLEIYLGTNANLTCGINTWPPDFDNNKSVNIFDIIKVAGNIGSSERRFDLNADGKVDLSDVNIVRSYFGKTCS